MRGVGVPKPTPPLQLGMPHLNASVSCAQNHVCSFLQLPTLTCLLTILVVLPTLTASTTLVTNRRNVHACQYCRQHTNPNQGRLNCVDQAAMLCFHSTQLHCWR